MSRFKFCLIGTSQSPVLELPVRDVATLHDAIGRARYIEGRMVEIDGDVADAMVLIPAARIQIIIEQD